MASRKIIKSRVKKGQLATLAARRKEAEREAAAPEAQKKASEVQKPKEPEPIKPIERKVRTATRKDMDTALAWFYSEIKGELGADGRAKSRIRRIPDKAFNPAKDPFIGGLFFYVYDAKHKATLPYWDKFPLVIPINIYNDGFLGLNLHYLPPMGRAKLLDMLMKYKRRAASPKAYMKVSYELLKQTVTMDLFQPCIHRYLTGHIKSNLVKVDDGYWDRAAMLPVQKFEGASAQEVWRKSASRIKRNSKKGKK